MSEESDSGLLRDLKEKMDEKQDQVTDMNDAIVDKINDMKDSTIGKIDDIRDSTEENVAIAKELAIYRDAI